MPKKKPIRKKVAKKATRKKKAVRKVQKKKPIRKKVAKKVAKKAVKKAAKKVPKKAPPPPPKSVPKPKPAPKPKRSVMKKAQRMQFRELLLGKRDALVGDLKSMESQAFKTSGQDSAANHMADHGSDAYEQDFTLGLIESDEGLVNQIDEALVRIESGEYGMCLSCEKSIPKARLEALPSAAFCVTCQEQNERF